MSFTPSHRPHVFALCVLVVSIIACSYNSAAPSRNNYGFTAEEAKAQEEKSKAKKIEAKRQEVDKIPGPQQYKAYVIALCEGYNDGLDDTHPDTFPGVLEIATLGDQIAQKASYDAHTIHAYKGLFLVCTKNFREGEQELLRSIEVKPSRDAGEMLAVLYSSSGEFERVGEICARVAPKLESQDRFMMMATCKESLHATNDESAFYWASEEDKTFWKNEQERLAKMQSKRAEPQERKRAEIIAQQQQEWQVERAEQKRLDICEATCTEQHQQCAKGCQDDMCRLTCNQTLNECSEGCEARVN